MNNLLQVAKEVHDYLVKNEKLAFRWLMMNNYNNPEVMQSFEKMTSMSKKLKKAIDQEEMIYGDR